MELSKSTKSLSKKKKKRKEKIWRLSIGVGEVAVTLPTQMLKFRGYSKCELATPRYIPENSKFLIKILQTEHHYRFTLPLIVAKKLKSAIQNK